MAAVSREGTAEDDTGRPPTGAVLVYGAGIAGMQASLDLAESGFKVYLVERSAAIGGRMSQLDKTFPTGDCAMCILSPKLVECGRNKNIEIITLAEIEGITRRAGQLRRVASGRSPRYVDLRKCNACGDCAEVCPVTLPSEFDRGLGQRKAIFRPYPQAIPNVYGISKADGTAPCKTGLPGGSQRAGLRCPHRPGQVQGGLRGHPRALPAAGGLRAHLPAPLRGRSATEATVDAPVAIRDLKRFATDWVYAHRDRARLNGHA